MRQRQHQPYTSKQTGATFALKIATIVAATIAMFYKELALAFQETLQNKTTIYILVVPFVVLYLVYRNRKMLRAVMPLESDNQPRNTRNLPSLSGILLAIIAILLYWQSSYTFTPLKSHIYVFTPLSIQTLALPIFAAGLVLILFNQQTLRQLVLPLAFLFFLIPPPSETLALAIMGGFILALTGTAIFLLASERTSKTHNLALNPLKCDQCNPELPTNTTYCRRCGRIIHPESARLRGTDLGKIVIILFVAGFLLAIQSPVFTTNNITPVVKISPSQYCQQTLPDINQYSLSTGTKDLTLTNAPLDLLSLDYTYYSNESVEVSVKIGMSSDLSNLPEHKVPPEWRLLPNFPIPIQIYSNYSSPIQAQYLVIESTMISSQYSAVLYWYTSSQFRIGHTAHQEQVQTQLTISDLSLNNLSALEPELVLFATNITNYWLARSSLPGETWAETAARPISDYGLNVSLALSIALAVILMFYAAETRKQRKENLTVVSKLSSFNVAIVKALQTTKPATIGNLIEELERKTGQTITPEELEQKLTELQNIGIIKSQISSQNNTPIQTWKV
jgi:hypothetical protein